MPFPREETTPPVMKMYRAIEEIRIRVNHNYAGASYHRLGGFAKARKRGKLVEHGSSVKAATHTTQQKYLPSLYQIWDT